MKVVTPSYRNRGWYLLCLSDRSVPVRAPLSSYPGQYKFRVWVRKNPLSIARFVYLAAPRVVLATQHEGHLAGTPARPDGLTVPGCAYNPLDCSVGAAPLPLPQLPYLGSPGRGGSHEQDKLDYLSDPTRGQAALSRPAALSDCTYYLDGLHLLAARYLREIFYFISQSVASRHGGCADRCSGLGSYPGSAITYGRLSVVKASNAWRKTWADRAWIRT